MISVRAETLGDHDQIHRVTIDAFANSEFGHNGEAELVDVPRAKSGNHLSLVACSNNEIVGHILFTPVVIRTPQQETRGMGLAPLSVSPQHQRIGVGSLLVTNGLNPVFGDGCPFVVVLGQAEYYPRFGFRSASEIAVSHGFSGIPQDVFFIQPHPHGTLTRLAGGAAYYEREFGPQHSCCVSRT